MKNIFIILGYGIPREILNDESYNIYLKSAFNAIFHISSTENLSPVIIFCGGKTDMVKPYERTEAEEMIKFFRILMEREICKEFTKDWKLIYENKSISGLENLLFAKEIIQNENIEAKTINLIFEITRLNRVEVLARKLFDKKINLIPFDFLQNGQRYVKPELIQERNNKVFNLDMQFFDKKISFEEHHNLYLERLRLLRADQKNHDEAVKNLWKTDKI